MSLQQEILRLKNELKSFDEEENKKPEEVVDEEPAIEEVVEEEVKEEVAAQEEEKKPDPAEEKKVDAEPADNAAWARMRREAAAANRRAEELEAKKAELEARIAALENHDFAQEAPAPIEDPVLSKIKETYNKEAAWKEFVAIEQDFSRKVPDYAAVSAQYAQALVESIRLDNPRANEAELREIAAEKVLRKAAAYVRAGFDPAEEMYHDAKTLGFTGKNSVENKETREVEEKIKPDMKKVLVNRQRSAGMAAAGGYSEGNLTMQTAASMSPREWAKLSADQKRALIPGL